MNILPPGAATVGVPARAGRRFEALDSLRGVCALIVVLYHYPVASHVGHMAFVRGGYLFVDFFFVLSGFVIAWNYGSRITDGVRLGEFLIRRFFRLVPLHWFILSLYLAVELWGLRGQPPGTPMGAETGKTLEGLIRAATMTNSFGMDSQSKWNMPSWSISAEWWTYVAFGLVALVTGRALKLGMAGMALLGAAVCVGYHATMHIVPDHGLLRCFFGFGLGGLLALLYPAVEPHVRRLGPTLLSVLEVAAILGVGVFVALSYDNAASFLAPVVFTIAVLVFAAEGGVVARRLHGRFWLRAGVLSYSIYLVHQFVMARYHGVLGWLDRRDIFRLDPTNPWHMDLQTLVVLGLVWVAAECTWRIAEKPGQQLGARLAKRWREAFA
ncbi:acyltransferase family protein [Sandaracinobacteroides hominis]|uniref:acyltransferase family protein n=1 Tax=Sandaracinobacteroides hominis TaxID=2780086 RepID=UPI0018F6CB89|nr:acyltransferase [Sandaracinobacteroides hominis]